MIDLGGLGPWLIGAAAVITAVGVLARPVWRAGAFLASLARTAGHFSRDWAGEEARPGVEARLGVMERLHVLERSVAEVRHEVRHDDGGSLKDAVRRTEEALADLTGRVDELAARPASAVRDVTVTPPPER
ncbi:hypothetical protein [Marinactinospora rubrisoli]|uniref:Uncharacterized protein n=1 Tax=Marinactinospora rubrisoli TaxID=2715399 RepID=A0ABW2KGN1_9ACTN